MIDGSNKNSDLPDSWKPTCLNDIAHINPRIDIAPLSDNLEVSFVPMKNVEALTGCIDLSERKLLGSVKKGYTSMLDGDVIFAKITPCMENGKMAIVEGAQNGIAFGSTEFHVIRLQKEIPQKYLFYYLIQQRIRKDAERAMTGSVGQKRVPTSYIKDLEIPIAPLPEQHRIVAKIEEVFSRLDAGVNALKQVQVQLKQYHQAVLKAAVEGRLTAQWREKHKGELESASELLKRILKERREKWAAEQLAKYEAKGQKPPQNWREKYKEPAEPDTSNLPELPEGWVWASLEQVAWDSRYGTSTKCEYDNTGMPVLRIPNVVSGRISLEDVKHAKEKSGVQSIDPLSPGDFLIVRTNGSRDLIGRAGLVELNYDTPHYFASYLIRFRIVRLDQLPRWIRLIWDTTTIRNQIIEEAGTSAGQYNISQTAINKFHIPLPPEKEQATILKIIDTIVSGLFVHEEELSKEEKRSDYLHQSILKRAFEGKLVPQDPNDEPAKVLLEKIKAEKAERKAERKATRRKKNSRQVELGV